MKKKNRIIVGITGASGFMYGLKALQLLQKLDVETHLVITQAGHLNRAHEVNLSAKQVASLADFTYAINELGAPIASGSFPVTGMLIAPCSMHTLAAIANGVADNLLIRAADVMLKERKKLILMVRETPLHLGHIKNMAKVTEYGAIVFPPVPALYTKPKTIDDILTHSVARALNLFNLTEIDLPRWGETISLTSE